MAVLYVDDGGSATSPYDTWAKAANDLATAMADAACVAGSTIYIGHNSVATYGALVTLTSAGTLINPVIIISADNTSGEPPTTYTAGAIEDADGGAYYIKLEGSAKVYGVTFKIGTDLSASTGCNWIFEDCEFEIDDDILIYGVALVHFINTNLTPTASLHIRIVTDGAHFIWEGGQLKTTSPTETSMFLCAAGEGKAAVMRNVDLSVFDGNGGTCHFFSNLTSMGGDHFLIEGCLLHADIPGLCLNEPIVEILGEPYKMVGCHSADAPYFEIVDFGGLVRHDSGIYRSGADPAANNFSVEMVSSAHATFDTPLKFELGHVWCSANPTLTVHCTHDVNGDGSDLQDDEFWIEIEYPDATNQAYRKRDLTSKMALLGTPGDLTTEGAAGWTNSQNVDNSIAETIAGGGAGLHTVWVCFARASETVYVCPEIDVT